MVASPQVGQRVRARYNKRCRDTMPYHDRLGTVVVAGRGKPRNHGVRFDGDEHLVVVPCGNLMPGEWVPKGGG